MNRNRDCDLETEDKNNDSICDVSDCQGQPGIGAIQVYDANGQYLGIHASGGIYIPSLEKFLHTYRDGFDDYPESAAQCPGVFYESNDCSGQPFIDCTGQGECFNGEHYDVIPDCKCRPSEPAVPEIVTIIL